MAVINPFNLSIPDAESHLRLFLRDSELGFGIATIFEVAAKLKAICESDDENSKYNWADIRTLIAIHARNDTVLNLASRLAMTKQALNKILRKLIAEDLVIITTDRRDKRRKILQLSVNGTNELARITTPMRDIIARAYRNAGADAVYGSDQVLWAILGESHIAKNI